VLIIRLRVNDEISEISQANAGFAEIVSTIAGVLPGSQVRRRAFAVLSELIKNKMK